MYIVVVGGGKVGFHLARALINTGQEVLCIERDPQRCAAISEELGSAAYQGDGCEVKVMEEVGVARADVLVAVTGDDEDNLVACQVAKHRFGVRRTIARNSNPKNKTLFHILGIDATVNSTEIILAQLAQEMPLHPLVSLLSIKGTGLELVDMQIPPGATAVGQRLSDIKLPGNSTIALVIAPDRGVRVASPDLVLQEEDEVVAVTSAEDEDMLRDVLTGPI